MLPLSISVIACVATGAGVAAWFRRQERKAAHEASRERSEHEQQVRRIAALSELIVGAPSPADLHRELVAALVDLCPGHDIALYVVRRRRLQLANAAGTVRWPDRLDRSAIAGDAPAGAGVSSIIALESDAHDFGLAPGRSEIVPIWLSGRLIGAVVTVAESRESPRPPVDLLRTIASLLAASQDREEKDAELRQSQKMDAVGQLAGGVAHDFNNLLTSIIGATTIARDQLNDPASVTPLLDDIDRASQHAAVLTRQMLTFSRKSRERPNDVCVHEIIEELDAMIRRLLPETITFETHLSQHRGVVHADRHAIEQVIWNLVLNARDAIEGQGKIRLSCAVEEGVEPHGGLIFSVEDDGVGMEPETVENIFQPFFTTKSAGRGTGLGLATVRRIIDDVGGTIDVQTREGEGSTFTVRMALSRPIDERPDIARTDVPRRIHARARKGERILLVEDHELVRTSMRELLTSAGYRVVAVPDGRAALEVLSRDGDLAAVVSDVVMPRVTGDELVRIMRGRGDLTPVVLLTGYAHDRLDVAESADLAGVPVLDKPVRPATLLQEIRRLLDRRHEQNLETPATTSRREAVNALRLI